MGDATGDGVTPCQDEPEALRGITAHILQSTVNAKKARIAAVQH